MTERDNTNDITRRTLLKTTAATGALAGLGGTAAAEYREVLEDVDVESAMQGDAARNFAILGIVGGWTGIGPAEIDSRTNPPLRLIEGEEHQVFWVNGDGNHHNFNIRNEDGDVVESTEIITEQGATQTLTFTADSSLAEYFCAPHPVQMRGPIELFDPGEVHQLRVDVRDQDGNSLLADVAVQGSGADGSIDERFGQYSAFSDILARGQASEDRGIARFDTLEDGTYTVTAWTYGHEQVSKEVTIDDSDQDVTIELPEVTPGEPTETYRLTLEEDQWRGEAPEDIAGQSNPTLTVTPGETYRVEWTNGIGRKELDEGSMHGEPLPGHNFVVARDTGHTILRSEFLTEQDETQSVDFVAEANLGFYEDQSQLEARGEIEVEEAAETTPEETTSEETTPEETTPAETPTPEETTPEEETEEETTPAETTPAEAETTTEEM
jgi:hypothetical protein